MYWDAGIGFELRLINLTHNRFGIVRRIHELDKGPTIKITVEFIASRLKRLRKKQHNEEVEEKQKLKWTWRQFEAHFIRFMINAWNPMQIVNIHWIIRAHAEYAHARTHSYNINSSHHLAFIKHNWSEVQKIHLTQALVKYTLSIKLNLQMQYDFNGFEFNAVYTCKYSNGNFLLFSPLFMHFLMPYNQSQWKIGIQGSSCKRWYSKIKRVTILVSMTSMSCISARRKLCIEGERNGLSLN